MKNPIKQRVIQLLSITLIVATLSATQATAQRRRATEELPDKKELSMEDILGWKRITESVISPDGEYIAVKEEPWKGASVIRLYNNRGRELFSADSTSGLAFDLHSKYLLFKKEEQGKGYSLGIYSLERGTLQYKEGVKSHYIAKKESGYLIVHSLDSLLTILKPGEFEESLSEQVVDYALAENENVMLTSQKEGVVKYWFPQLNLNKETLWQTEREISVLSISEDGTHSAFLIEEELFINTPKQESLSIAKGVSSKGKIHFSPDNSKLYFGLKVELPQRDTTLSKEEFPEVHIWHWNEKVQFTQQLVNLKKDKEAYHTALYTIEKGEVYTITNSNVSEIHLIDKGNSNQVILLSNTRYQLEQMWSGRHKVDIYLVDTYLERVTSLLYGVDGYPQLSPAGKYLYWYSAPDSSWVTYSLQRDEKVFITPPLKLPVYNAEGEVPDWPSSFSSAGWSADDKEFFVYDKYDMWSVDPSGKESPLNITKRGREQNFTFRLIKRDAKSDTIERGSDMLFHVFNNKTKGWGYYTLEPNGGEPKALYKGDFALSIPIKASKADSWIFTRETYSEFPDISFTNSNFSAIKKITNTNPQQSNFIWGSAKLISWSSYEGEQIEGIVYLPQNYDSTKLYPVVVNFYERNSSTLHSYRTPEPHRSTIDYHWYNSHGYIIFNPDVHYKEGYPGESAFNSVMPGVTKLIEERIAHPAKIGAQGHSWGGYQVAYLATRTNLFAAIESGAPVVNMYSAYGGIRWETGLNRAFQYEHQQSRIGYTPWESPLRYIENSPIFTMDKVNTPILIMHNDNDGHVPWYQGIEYFVALKRLRKPVWLLNYTGEVHWPQKLKNKVDFQIRMKQFFDHYLNGVEAPRWMDPGVSAIELEGDLGY